jgi:hypothetical protein
MAVKGGGQQTAKRKSITELLVISWWHWENSWKRQQVWYQSSQSAFARGEILLKARSISSREPCFGRVGMTE